MCTSCCNRRELYFVDTIKISTSFSKELPLLSTSSSCGAPSTWLTQANQGLGLILKELRSLLPSSILTTTLLNLFISGVPSTPVLLLPTLIRKWVQAKCATFLIAVVFVFLCGGGRPCTKVTTFTFLMWISSACTQNLLDSPPAFQHHQQNLHWWSFCFHLRAFWPSYCLPVYCCLR